MECHILYFYCCNTIYQKADTSKPRSDLFINIQLYRQIKDVGNGLYCCCDLSLICQHKNQNVLNFTQYR